ncbi:hypothetical protein EON81_08545 [bacterium]|nr:MAG: hypothetical protein EON81_08545 [bacterium]
MNRAPLALFLVGLSALALAQDPVDDAPRPGEGLGLRLGGWFPSRTGSDQGFSYGVGYLLPSVKPLRYEVEYYGSSARFTNSGGRQNVNLYKIGVNGIYTPYAQMYYFGAGLGVGGGSGTGSNSADLVVTALAGYRLNKNLFVEARYQGASKSYLNGFGINIGYRY